MDRRPPIEIVHLPRRQDCHQGRRRLLRWLPGLVALGSAVDASAQAPAYPARPVTLVVPFPPGGPSDANARLVAGKLSVALGQPVIIDNRPGASGSLGTEFAARAANDGYTLLAGTMGTHALNPVLQGHLRYDAVRDFVPIRTTIAVVNVLVVNAERPYRTVADLLAFARQNPGRINYGTAGAGTGNALAADLFQKATGVRLTPVAYKGNAPALNDLLGGTLDAMFGYPAETVAHIRSGKIRALAVGHVQRIEILPEVPTLAEAGVQGADLITWGGIFAPTGTAAPIVRRLDAELDRVMRDPDVVRSLREAGALPYSIGGDEFAQLVKHDAQRWPQLLRP